MWQETMMKFLTNIIRLLSRANIIFMSKILIIFFFSIIKIDTQEKIGKNLLFVVCLSGNFQQFSCF